jgi:pimeloyl-ACP methyl ester carboxylesterase
LFADAPARAARARALALDRPGIGRSTPHPGRRLLDWPCDVAAFADAFGLERFAVLGWSGGGPYAIACAHVLGQRVSATGLAAGVRPHGNADTLVSRRHAELLAERLRAARLHVPPGLGHLFPLDHARDLLAALV